MTHSRMGLPGGNLGYRTRGQHLHLWCGALKAKQVSSRPYGLTASFSYCPPPCTPSSYLIPELHTHLPGHSRSHTHGRHSPWLGAGNLHALLRVALSDRNERVPNCFMCPETQPRYKKRSHRSQAGWGKGRDRQKQRTRNDGQTDRKTDLGPQGVLLPPWHSQLFGSSNSGRY